MTIEGKTAKEYNKKKISSWAIQVQWDNGDIENITEMPAGVAHEVDEFLTDLENEQKTRKRNAKSLHWSPAMASATGTKLQAPSRKLQASSSKLDKGPVLCYRIFKEKEI